MNFDLSKILTLKEAFDKECAELKAQFEATVKDSSIPLDDRWVLWLKAPKELKNQAPWIRHLTLPDFGEISWYDEGGISRKGAEVVLEYVYDNFMERNDSEHYDSEDRWSEADFIAFKTWVLDQNLYSFCWKW